MINDQVETSVRPLRSGIWFSDPDGGSCYKWAVFNASDADSASDPCYDLTGWCRSYGGPGRAFSDDPVMKRFGRKVLVTQRCGLDI